LSEVLKGESYYLTDKIGVDLTILKRDLLVMRKLLLIKNLQLRLR